MNAPADRSYTACVNLSDPEKTVCEWIASHADQMYTTLERHVAIPTGHDYAPGLTEYRDLLCETLESLGATNDLRAGHERPWWMEVGRRSDHEKESPPEIQPIVIAQSSGALSDRKPRILIAGHMDTVHKPNDSFCSLTRVSDGKTATGPGAVDMKGGIVCALFALRALHDAGNEINWTFLLNSDEEKGTFQSEHVLREEAARHDYGIALEPALSDGSLATARMGSGQFMIETHGVSAHVGREFDKGRSAVNRLAEILVALGEMADPVNGMIVNVGPILGGTATNVVPDYAACWGNVRFRDTETGERLGGMIDSLARDDENELRTKVHRHWNRPAKPLTPEVEQFALRARKAAEDIGQSLPFASTGGVCDGNILQDAGLPTLDTLGIRGGNLHRTDEFIEIDALTERAQLLAVLLLRIGMENGS